MVKTTRNQAHNIFVNKENYNSVKLDLKRLEIPTEKIFVLDIPDQYEFNNPELVEICKK